MLWNLRVPIMEAESKNSFKTFSASIPGQIAIPFKISVSLDRISAVHAPNALSASSNAKTSEANNNDTEVHHINSVHDICIGKSTLLKFY